MIRGIQGGGEEVGHIIHIVRREDPVVVGAGDVVEAGGAHQQEQPRIQDRQTGEKGGPPLSLIQSLHGHTSSHWSGAEKRIFRSPGASW